MTADDDFVRTVEASMRAAVARTPIAAPACRLLDAGGKRLRARLVWWSANASADSPCNPRDEALVRAAAAIELAHLGSLIHDDIVDGGETRRGVPTLHRAHGIQVATDAGAALAHVANEIAASLGRRVRRGVRRALLATCRGQVRELAVPFVMLPPRTRLAVMQEKTGAFFELAANLGAILGGGDVRAGAAVRRFARRFGVAFQIADDVLDLTGDPSDLGRANGADLRDGVLTLPVLLADDPRQRLLPMLARVRETRDADAVAACASLVVNGGGVAAASSVASWWLDRAVGALQSLPTRDACAHLVDLARSSIARGLRRGPATFAGEPQRSRPMPAPVAPFIDTQPVADHAPSSRLPERLIRVLEWFHPGFSAMVAARARDASVDARRGELRRALYGGADWSRDSEIAGDAIALAHALATDRPLHDDPVRTLALVDALHCAAIGFLALTPDAREHARMAARARRLLEREPVGGVRRSTFAGAYEQPMAHLSA